MTLTDTGPLVALIDESDGYHVRVKQAARAISWPMVTTEACLTEALYLLGESAGWPGQEALWLFVSDNSLGVLNSPINGPRRASGFMKRFRDQPCDYADATLLVAAEETGLRRIFTIDKHFNAYRLTNGESVEIIL